jgi:hypothetical protein
MITLKPLISELIPKLGWFWNKLSDKPVKPGLSTEFKAAFPKTEVLGKGL